MGIPLFDQNFDESRQADKKRLMELFEQPVKNISGESNAPLTLVDHFQSLTAQPDITPLSVPTGLRIEFIKEKAESGDSTKTIADQIKDGEINSEVLGVPTNFSVEIVSIEGKISLEGLSEAAAHSEVLPSKDKSLNFILFLGSLMMSAAMRDAALGDMEETFRKQSLKFGTSGAKIILLKDLGSSIIPVVYAFASGVIVKLLKFAGFYKLIKFLFEKFSGS